MDRKQIKKLFRKTWHFIWEDNSIWSWLVNIVLAFILIKFIVYPGLGFILSTSHPIVAVVSSSMEHNADFEEWWSRSGVWYASNNITKDDFLGFSLRAGFNKGDIMVLKGGKPKDIKIGDVIVFRSARVNPKPDPIIHRIVQIEDQDGKIVYQTKGDNYRTNSKQINGCFPDGCIYESDIWGSQIIGRAVARIPFLGWVKIAFVELVNLLR
ncbi:signal peptidase I [Candidatus Woesearchaeota archaeon]|nr:signal peptidase I [Candidatus Woesearchaeota archaeon]